MCTVTYLPLNNGYFLTSNRDESLLRPMAIPPKKYLYNNHSLFFPKDPVAGGSWIVTDENEYSLCLLNGAQIKHIKKGNYKKSRGLILLDFFNYPTLETFINEYDFNGFEPFTLIIIKNCPRSLFLLRWDETNLTLTELDHNQGYIWSSCTLYDIENQSNREKWFRSFLNDTKAIKQRDIIKFHSCTEINDLDNGLVIKRTDLMQTVSITSVSCNENRIKIYYHDLRNNKEYRFRIFQMMLK